jgi:hypothetical protein
MWGVYVMQKHETVTRFKVLKTKEGYLHHEISEGWWLEDGERNYEFTDDVFQAYEFNDCEVYPVPKYIEVTHDEEIKTPEQLCHVLDGEFVIIEVKKTVEWNEIYE